jgi:hypothetical protein
VYNLVKVRNFCGSGIVRNLAVCVFFCWNAIYWATCSVEWRMAHLEKMIKSVDLFCSCLKHLAVRMSSNELFLKWIDILDGKSPGQKTKWRLSTVWIVGIGLDRFGSTTKIGMYIYIVQSWFWLLYSLAPLRVQAW